MLGQKERVRDAQKAKVLLFLAPANACKEEAESRPLSTDTGSEVSPPGDASCCSLATWQYHKRNRFN